MHTILLQGRFQKLSTVQFDEGEPMPEDCSYAFLKYILDWIEKF